MNNFWLLVGAGIIDAAVLAPAAVGLTMQFGVTNYVNFAYGAFLTLSAFLFWTLNGNPSGPNFNVWSAGLLAACGTAIAALAMGALVYGPYFRRRPQLLYMLVLTFIISLLMDAVIAAIWGGRSAFELTYPAGADTVLTVGPFVLSPLDIAYLILSVASLSATFGILRYTRIGKMMRAISDDRALAAVCGLPVRRTTNVAWLFTGFLAGIAGDILALQSHGFDAGLGDGFIYLVFAAVVFGGIGRAYGAVIGALVIGLVFQLSSLVVGSALSPAAVFAVLVIVMLVRPSGLLGSTGRSVLVSS